MLLAPPGQASVLMHLPVGMTKQQQKVHSVKPSAGLYPSKAVRLRSHVPGTHQPLIALAVLKSPQPGLQATGHC